MTNTTRLPAARFPDHIDEDGFPWWDDLAETTPPRPQPQPRPTPSVATLWRTVRRLRSKYGRKPVFWKALVLRHRFPHMSALWLARQSETARVRLTLVVD